MAKHDPLRSYAGGGHEMAHNLSHNNSILFKIVSFESFSNVYYTHLINLGFIVIKKIWSPTMHGRSDFVRTKVLSYIEYRVQKIGKL